jgi:hypothetical protein
MENEPQNQQVNQIPVTASSSQTASPTPKSKLLLLLGGLLLLLFIGGGAYYLGTQNGKTDAPVQNNISDTTKSTTQTTTPTPSPINDSNEITTGKTYTNTKYGYLLKYPNDWKVELGVDGAPGDDSKLETVYQVKFNSNTIPEEKLTVWVAVRKSLYTNIEDFSTNLGKTKPNRESTTVYSKEQTTLDSIPALKYVRSQIGVGRVMDVTAIKNGYEYTITLEHPDTESQNISTFNQLLSSFSFTN